MKMTVKIFELIENILLLINETASMVNTVQCPRYPGNSTIANNKKCSKFTALFKLCYSLLQLKIADPQELSPDFSKRSKVFIEFA